MQSSSCIRLQHQRHACCRKAKQDAIREKVAKKEKMDADKKAEKLKVNDELDVKYKKEKNNPHKKSKSNLPYLAEYQRRKEEKLSSS